MFFIKKNRHKNRYFTPVNFSQYLTGFTLMEVLIASTIFAAVMIMATAVFAQSSAFRTKLAEMRRTSEDARMLADQITRDVRSANSPARINLGGSAGIKDFRNGIALVKYNSSTDNWSFVCNGEMNQPADPFASTFIPSYIANALVLAADDKYIVYYSNGNSIYRNDQIARVNGSGTIVTLTAANIAGVQTDSKKISNPDDEAYINFSGIADDDTIANKQQSIVFFYIITQTKNYANLKPGLRHKAVIESGVSSRSYNY